MTFFNRNMKYEYFVMLDKITKFDNKMNTQIEKILHSLISTKYNNCYQRII